MADLKDKRIIFIFDECHRSQFGDTHNRIKDFFNNAQMFGFTGTPIFADNSNKNELGKRTTKDLFEDRIIGDNIFDFCFLFELIKVNYKIDHMLKT